MLVKGNNKFERDDLNALYEWYFEPDWSSAYTGLAKNSYGTWYVDDGILNKYYDGLIKTTKNDLIKPSSWVYIQNGQYSSNYTGLGENPYGVWYFKNGTIQKTYTGYVNFLGNKYYVVKGLVDAKKSFENLNERIVAKVAMYLDGFKIDSVKIEAANVTEGWDVPVTNFIDPNSFVDGHYLYTVKLKVTGPDEETEKTVTKTVCCHVAYLPLYDDVMTVHTQKCDSVTTNINLKLVDNYRIPIIYCD